MATQRPTTKKRRPTSRKSTRLIAQFLDELGRRYEEHADPFQAWEAYRTARNCGMAIPPWVLAYLDRAAAALHVMAERVDGAEIEIDAAGLVHVRMKPGRAPLLAPRVAAALEMRGSVLSQRVARRRDAALASATAARVARGEKETKAAARVAKARRGVDMSTVWRAYSYLKATGHPPTI